MPSPELASAVIKVGDGRGFIIKLSDDEGYIITASHCLPNLPPVASGGFYDERTYQNLIGPLGAEATPIWAECMFVDPVSDIAVLGMPDSQELSAQADDFEALLESAATGMRIGSIKLEKQTRRMPSGHVIEGPPMGTDRAWMLSLDGHWFHCRVRTRGRSLWIDRAAEAIQGGMSGSPIIGSDGTAVGILCTSGGIVGQEHREGGPNPALAFDLPVWLVRDLTKPREEEGTQP